MLRFIVFRLIWVVITVWAVASISFFMVRLAPGDPFQNEFKALPEAVKETRRREYRLDEPLLVQYGYWLGNMCLGDFGPSMKYKGKSVRGIIVQTLPVSLALGSLAMVFALTLGLTTGVISALRQNSAWDYGMMTIAVLGISLPSFVIATLLIIGLVFGLNIFPLAGWTTFNHVLLPAAALSLPFAARISRLARVGMLEVLGEDYIRTAYAKGLKERHVVIKHALKGAILPVVSFLGPAFALADALD